MERRVARQRPAGAAVAEQGTRPSADQVDVDQIMREIRNRISSAMGLKFSTQQIQDLAARRLEAILEPRNINPTLLDQLRKAPRPPDPLPPNTDATADSFADDAIYAGVRWCASSGGCSIRC